MKVVAPQPVSRQFIQTHLLIDFKGSWLAVKWLVVFLFTGITVCYAQREPAGFYEQVDATMLIDSNAHLFISSIQVNGNKKTKRYIIEREMRLKAGDSIPAAGIYEKLIRSQELIYNTTLFTEVSLVPFFNSATDISIHVTVKEKWYIYPTPQFQLVDRNINEWLNAYNADLERVIYGARFAHYNLSGRRDQLRIYLLNGYARNLSFIYNAPYSNKTLTEGFSIGASYTQNREVIYKTSDQNLPVAYKNKGFVRNNFHVGGSYIMRKGFYRRHVFSLGYYNLNVDDSVTKTYNPSYFNTAKNYIGYPEVGYTYQYINTNNVNYPLTGKIYSLVFLKKGTGITGGINMLSVDGDYNKYLAHGKNWYSIVQAHVKIKAPFTQPYINQRAFGYGDFYVRGLEKYVVDGVASSIVKFTLKKKIISFNIPVPIKNKVVSQIPITLFAKTFADAGYSYNKMPLATLLGNRFLYSGGFGIDILSLYDLNLRVEYSFNQLGEKGLFLHAKGGF